MSDDPAAIFEEMKRYVRFDEADAARLRALRERARPHFESIAREFYERAREHEAAHAVFRDEAQIDRLHRSLVGWLERMLSGPYDDDYAVKSARIGRVHVHVGLPQRYMFSAMTLFRKRLTAIAHELPGDQVLATTNALSRILDLELALMNGEYHRALVERTERLERQTRDHLLDAMQRTERRYVRAVDMAGVMMIGLDISGRIQLFNPEAARVTGHSALDAQGLPFAATLLADDNCDFAEEWAAAVAATEPTVRPLSFAIRTRSGKLRVIDGHLCRSPEPGERPDETIVLLCGRDITGERALAARVRRAERLAAVGTLAAGLAHEIRNPLNGAQLHLTYLSRALRDHGDGELHDAMHVVSSEISRLSALVNDFLHFARPTRVTRAPTRMQDVCARAVAIVDKPEGVRVDCDMADSDIVAEVDRDRIEQVVINLLQNAVEAADNGGGLVALTLRREPRFAVVSVHDDGPGLPPDAPIFDAFYTTKASGTGLGLAIVHRIVEDHDGHIEVESAPGRTLFRVRLPLTDPEQIGVPS